MRFIRQSAWSCTWATTTPRNAPGRGQSDPPHTQGQTKSRGHGWVVLVGAGDAAATPQALMSCPCGAAGVSVSVSTFSLVAIALERYSAICNPLQSRAWQTRSHACRVIAGTWLAAALLMVPYAVYSTTRPAARGVRPLTTQCTHRWPSEHVRQGW